MSSRMITFPIHPCIRNKTMRESHWNACCHILEIGLSLNIFSWKFSSWHYLLWARQPHGGTRHLKDPGCKLERMHKWTKFGDHLRPWWTFVNLTKAFVQLGTICHNWQFLLWGGPDLEWHRCPSFSPFSVWITGTKFTQQV